LTDHAVLVGNAESQATLSTQFYQAPVYQIVAETTTLTLAELPAALPEGKTFAAAFTIKLMQNGIEVGEVPGGAQFFFNIPVGLSAPFTVLFWPGTEWVEIPSKVVGGQVVFTVTKPGIYVLVTP
jgi:hypothetical protein